MFVATCMFPSDLLVDIAVGDLSVGLKLCTCLRGFGALPVDNAVTMQPRSTHAYIIGYKHQLRSTKTADIETRARFMP